MSYSSDLKEKLVRESRHHQSELAGFLQSCGSFHLKGHGQLDVSFETMRNPIARHYYRWIQSVYGLEVGVEHFTRMGKVYRVRVKQANSMLESLGLLTKEEELYSWRRDIPISLVSGEIGLRSYITGVFLGAGQLSNPNRSYHLEFSFDHETLRNSFAALLNQYELEGKHYRRNNKPALYFKNSESISDFLKIIGATEEAFAFENIRIVKEVKNDIQRKVNLETANITKTVVASQKLVDCIELIQRERGLSSLPDALREIAQLRWEEPDLSLKELGERLDPPISKSGVNHRLSRLLAICKKIQKPTKDGSLG
ncbi:MAG: DNA-binding protein WhiA [Tissierellia bacterium]|jgi:DNA-binding protein WhiA|nr:DNA-binding protein WhiA [Tissierellia bacterium]